MSFTLSTIPGFADLPDLSLAHDDPVLGIHLNKISQNAAFAKASFEIFTANYVHGQTVALPISRYDQYAYARSELIYIWGVASTLNPGTQWISGLDCLWYAAWNVAQWNDADGADNSKAGLVECIEWYRRSGSNATPTSSNDGTLFVVTVAQRLRNSLVMAQQADTWTELADADIVTDAAFTESMVRTLNRNAKFAVVAKECFYVGEFVDGDTIPLASLKSPRDQYEYSYAQCSFQFSLRWTTLGTSFTAPEMVKGQLAPTKVSIDGSTGAVTIDQSYVEDSGDLVSETGFGRIAVFAFCSRLNLVSGLGTASFTEIDEEIFFPGQPLKASTLVQLNKNIRAAVVAVEFSAPAEYADNDTIPIITSPIDSYAYSRDELSQVWEWSDTTPDSGNNLRVVGWKALVGPLGTIAMNVWRLPPSEKWVIAGAGEHMRLLETSIGIRDSTHSTIVNTSSNPPSDGGPVPDQGNSGDGFNTVTGPAPYNISLYSGPTGQPGASAIILAHDIGGLVVPGVTFPSGLAGSYVGCLTAPSADFVITIKQAGSTVGTMTIASGATSGTFSFTDDISAVPGELWTFVGPATPDTTIAGIHFTLAGIRTGTGSTTPPPSDPGSGQGAGGAGVEDILNWMLNSDRANTHYVAPDNPFYTYAAGNKIWWVKGSAGHPWDIQLFDSTYVYLWITENGDESAWSNASAYKRYAVSHGNPTPQGVPFAPRFYTPGSPVTLDSPTPNNIHRTLSCETDGEPLINLGNIRCVTTGPTSEAWGGDVGTRDTIIINYYYGSSYGQRERFHLVKGVGHVSWDYATGTFGGSYTIHQSTFKVNKAIGGSPTPYFPCATGASWWI